MKLIKVFKDHTGQWREENPFPEGKIVHGFPHTQDWVPNYEHSQFERKLVYYDFPNAPDTKPGEVVEAYLQWQYWHLVQEKWYNEKLDNYQYFNGFDDYSNRHELEAKNKTRQILVLASPQESKEQDKEEHLLLKASRKFERLMNSIPKNVDKGKSKLLGHFHYDHENQTETFMPVEKQSPSAQKVESAEDDKRLEILNRCSPDFYPVKDDNGHLYPAYGHDNVLEAMKQYAALQTSSLQSQLAEKQLECEGLREDIIDMFDYQSTYTKCDIIKVLNALNKKNHENRNKTKCGRLCLYIISK